MKTGATPATAPQARAGDSAQRPTAGAKRRNQPRAGLEVKPDPRSDQGRPEPMCVSHAVDERAAYSGASLWPNDWGHLPGRLQMRRVAENQYGGPVKCNPWFAADSRGYFGLLFSESTRLFSNFLFVVAK